MENSMILHGSQTSQQQDVSVRLETSNPVVDLRPADGLDHEQRLTVRSNVYPVWREFLFVGIISCAQFCSQAGLGQCVAIIDVISDHFGLLEPGEKSWLIAAYSLTAGTFILIAGRFGDMFGYRLMIIIGFSWFSIWSLIGGFSYYSNHILFNFTRAMQGIGPAILLPNGLAMLGASYTAGRRKNFAFSIFAAMAPTGCILGSIFAGLFNLTFWPWTFWAFSIALAGLALGVVAFVYEPPRKPKAQGRNFRQVLKEMDILGATCGVTVSEIHYHDSHRNNFSAIYSI